MWREAEGWERERERKENHPPPPPHLTPSSLSTSLSASHLERAKHVGLALGVPVVARGGHVAQAGVAARLHNQVGGLAGVPRRDHGSELEVAADAGQADVRGVEEPGHGVVDGGGLEAKGDALGQAGRQVGVGVHAHQGEGAAQVGAPDDLVSGGHVSVVQHGGGQGQGQVGGGAGGVGAVAWKKPKKKGEREREKKKSIPSCGPRARLAAALGFRRPVRPPPSHLPPLFSTLHPGRG